jgi:prefoldin subunit 5
LGEIEARFSALRETGSNATGQLEQAIAGVRASVAELAGSLDGGQSRADDMTARAREIDAALAAITARLGIEMPAALVRVEEQTERARLAVSSIEPQVSGMEASANNAVLKLAETEGSVARHREAFAEMSRTLEAQLAQVEARFASLRESGSNSVGQLGDAISLIAANVHDLSASLDGGQARASEITSRAHEIGASLAAITSELEERAPAALARVQEQAERTEATTSRMLPQIEAIQASSASAAERIAEAEQSLARQQAELDALLARLSQGVAAAQGELQGLGTAAAEADSAAARIVSQTAPELIDALVRVREASNQAATHAREAIAAVIPQSVAALADASRDAVGGAITGPVQEQVQELGKVADRAVEAARAASERLTRQMLKIGESAAAVEARIDEARRDRDAKESENFSRRVALLIESLNSTAIDVTKILSNEVTDSAWAAYLKGDRGVFTRRAVRLIDNSEAREIVQHYENEPEFREQVNRYIHDFESMLRRILADRDSSALGVTILSSDMGKLYVALAQAIERLR